MKKILYNIKTLIEGFSKKVEQEELNKFTYFAPSLPFLMI